MNKWLILVLVLFVMIIPVSASTYYIDYTSGNDANAGTKTLPWKNAPGMVGFAASYSHSAGDVFVFKGGITWTSAALPLAIDYSGNVGNVDTYTVDKTWYSGGSWTQPTFDMEQIDDQGIFIDTKNYIMINDIKIINPIGTSYDHRLLSIGSSNNITIQNCTLDGSNSLDDSTPIEMANIENITIDSCYIKGKQNSGNPDGILIRPWYKIKNIIIRNNEITMPIGSGGDGIHIDAEIPSYDIDPSNSAFYNDFSHNYSNILIERNNFHNMAGKMFISVLAGAHNITIRYNLFHDQQNDRIAIDFDGSANGAPYYYSNCSVYYNKFYNITGNIANWGGIIRVVNPDKNGSQNNIINNNIFVQNGSYPEYEIGIKFYNNAVAATWKVKNNIFMGLSYGIDGGSSADIDTNLFYNNQNNGTIGTNPIGGNPTFTNITNEDYTLLSNSSAINKGVNWGQTRDIIGITMQGSAWDIGAYEYVSEGTPLITNVINGTVTESTAIINFTVNQSSALTQIKYSTDLSLSSSTTNQTTGTDRSETLINLDANMKYYYSVFAYNSANTSLYSNSTIQNFTTAKLSVSLSNLGDTLVTLFNPDTNFGSQAYLITYDHYNEPWRSYLRFNLSSLPDGAIIDSATLSLYAFQIPFPSPTVSIYHDFGNTWVESVLTWNNQAYPTGINLTTEDTKDVSTVGWWNWSVKNMIENSTSNGYGNISILMKTPETYGGYREAIFYSREYSDSTKRPNLTITYTLSETAFNQLVYNTGWQAVFINSTQNMTSIRSMMNSSNVQWIAHWNATSQKFETYKAGWSYRATNNASAGEAVYLKVANNDTVYRNYGNGNYNWTLSTGYNLIGLDYNGSKTLSQVNTSINSLSTCDANQIVYVNPQTQVQYTYTCGQSINGGVIVNQGEGFWVNNTININRLRVWI
jgi:hypothetical protein